MTQSISSSSSSSSQPIGSVYNHPDISVITEDHLEDFIAEFSALSTKETHNVDMDKMLVTCGKTKSLATDGVGAGMVFCARARTMENRPILGLWHRSASSDTSFRAGIIKLRRSITEKGFDPNLEINLFVVGGQKPDPENDTPGNLEEEAEILNLVNQGLVTSVMFNYSKNEDEPLEVLLTPDKLYVSKESLFERSSDDYVGHPMNFDIHHHPDICVIDDGDSYEQLAPYSFDDIPNVDMDKMLITIGDGNFLGTDSLGACIAICLRGETKDDVPILALWHRTPASDLPFEEGIHRLKHKMYQMGCDLLSNIEVFAIGGQNPSSSNSVKESPQSPSSLVSSPTPGTLEEEADLLEKAQHLNIQGVLFNFSESQREPLEVVLTSSKIFVSKQFNIFQSSESNKEAGVVFLENSE
ncbi:MAG: hypothetical protein JSS32_01770 [Verrucomicrobia bacterium]|nr:hypothetical protein [Verrucomicrobiota bacterium]